MIAASVNQEGGNEEVRYRDAVHAMECGNKKVKTTVAWFMLSGRGGAKVEPDGAVCLLKERVADDDSEAMWILGICNEFGIGTEQDLEQAELLYGKSRDSENAIGLFLSENIRVAGGSGTIRVRNTGL